MNGQKRRNPGTLFVPGFDAKCEKSLLTLPPLQGSGAIDANTLPVLPLCVPPGVLQNGANPSARDRRNRTAEHWAYKQGHMHMILVKVVMWLSPPIKQY